MTAIDADGMSLESAEAGATLTASGEFDLAVDQPACIAVRPEKIFISRDEPADQSDIRIKGVVDDLAYLGNLSLYRVRLGSGKIIHVSQQNRQRSAQRSIEWEDEIWVSWRPRSSIVLAEDQ